MAVLHAFRDGAWQHKPMIGNARCQIGRALKTDQDKLDCNLVVL